jgi:hypothetical protein
MPSDQRTRVPHVPIRTPMFEPDGRLSRTWIIFFERLWMQPQSGDVPGGGAGPAELDRKATFGLVRPLEVSERLTLYYIVRKPGRFVDCVAKIAEQAPTGTDAILDIQRSRDDGATWESIFPEDGLMILPADNTATMYTADFSPAVDGVEINDLLRIGCLQTGAVDPGKGIEVVLQWAGAGDTAGNGTVASAEQDGTAVAS